MKNVRIFNMSTLNDFDVENETELFNKTLEKIVKLVNVALADETVFLNVKDKDITNTFIIEKTVSPYEEDDDKEWLSITFEDSPEEPYFQTKDTIYHFIFSFVNYEWGLDDEYFEKYE